MSGCLVAHALLSSLDCGCGPVGTRTAQLCSVHLPRCPLHVLLLLTPACNPPPMAHAGAWPACSTLLCSHSKAALTGSCGRRWAPSSQKDCCPPWPKAPAQPSRCALLWLLIFVPPQVALLVRTAILSGQTRQRSHPGAPCFRGFWFASPQVALLKGCCPLWPKAPAQPFRCALLWRLLFCTAGLHSSNWLPSSLAEGASAAIWCA